MKKFLLAPDSFKGTMSGTEICQIMEKEIRRIYPDAQVISLPIADGGEGTVDAFLTAAGGEKVFRTVQGPFGEPVRGFYGRLSDGTAVIEMAAAAGLPLTKGRKNVEKASTYGVGELMLAALQAGAEKMIVGLGGSATNDGGCGAACALGLRFFDESGNAFIPVGETLQKICKIDFSGACPLLKNCRILTMCDIDNPLYGEAGAAVTFGPQKGADDATVKMLDEGLFHLARVIERETGKEIGTARGAGAAGGMGGGMMAFFNSPLSSGIETVLEAVSFEEKLIGACAVFTGEGKLDGQSVMGKAISGIARRTKTKQIPLIAVVGDVGREYEKAYAEGVTAVFSINRVAAPYSVLQMRARDDLRQTMADIMRLMQSLEPSAF